MSGKLAFGGLKLSEALRGRNHNLKQKLPCSELNLRIRILNCIEAVASIWDEKSASEVILNDHIGKFFRNTIERKKNGNSASNCQTENPEGSEGDNGEDSSPANFNVSTSD